MALDFWEIAHYINIGLVVLASLLGLVSQLLEFTDKLRIRRSERELQNLRNPES